MSALARDGLEEVAHQSREDRVGFIRFPDLILEQRVRVRVEGRFSELLWGSFRPGQRKSKNVRLGRPPCEELIHPIKTLNWRIAGAMRYACASVETVNAMTHLSVNLNAVAMLRNRRSVPWPSVLAVARIALDAGADGLTVHPRPDERHIRRTDVFDLVELIREDFPDREFNIEGYPTDDFLDLVERAAPDQVTFVPDDPLQATSDHGWNIGANDSVLIPAIDRMRRAGIRVSLFIDADPSAPAAAVNVGADRIEMFTGPYGGAKSAAVQAMHLEGLRKTAEAARVAGSNARPGNSPLLINAGHDLNLDNLPPLKAAIPDLAEVSIGHAVTADTLTYGMAETVRRYKAACT